MDLLGEYDSSSSVDYEDRSLKGNLERLENLLMQGEVFDVLYKDAGGRIGSEEVEAQDLSSIEAVNFLLGEANDFDRYMVRWDGTEISSLRVYENIREGILGSLLPKRGDEVVFKYLEE